MRMPTPLVGMVIGTLLPVQAAQAPSADEVRDRLAAYLSIYEADISTLVATEVMTQSIDARYNRSLRINEPGPRRTLESEVAFVGLPGDAGLLGFRRVVKVDGRPVPSPGTSIAELLQTLAPLDAARRLLDESARYNLGRLASGASSPGPGRDARGVLEPGGQEPGEEPRALLTLSPLPDRGQGPAPSALNRATEIAAGVHL